MTEPSKERIAAALALAEAAVVYLNQIRHPTADSDFTPVEEAIDAYRATAPRPLRTRAEVDAEIAKLTRECVENEWAGDDDPDRWDAVTKLCREPTADPEPDRGNPLVRITWQCSSCGWGYFGPLQEACPGCGAEGFWSGSVAPDCKPWPGYPCAPAPGVKARPANDASVPTALEVDRAQACDASVGELVRALQEGNKFLQDQLVAANAARRLRLAEIYHLTITYGDDPAMALLAIRNASGPGA